MITLLGIILSLLVFIGIVMIHELGHFTAARLTKTKVEEFGIGIPPTAINLGTDKKGTKYTLNWLPIGWFVRLKGEDVSDPSSSDIDAFASRPYLARSLVILAGVTANFILAIALFSGLFYHGISPIAFNSQFKTSLVSELVPTVDQAIQNGALISSGVVVSPFSGSIAETSGIKNGDYILSINNTPIQFPSEVVKFISETKEGEKLNFSIKREGEIRTISLAPQWGKVGMSIGYDIKGINTSYRMKYSGIEAIQHGARETWIQFRMTGEMLGSLVQKIVFPKNDTERKVATESVGWPIAIAWMFVDLSKTGFDIALILAIAGLLSINLGVFNLLPLPALDGGRFVTTTIVSIFELFGFSQNRIRPLEAYIHMAGFAILLLLSMVIAFHDVLKFF